MMKAVLLAMLTGASALAQSNQVNVVVNLTDGSRLVGRIAAADAMLPVTTEMMGRLNVPLARIRQLDCAGGLTNATVVLQNGDKLRGLVRVDALGLKTIFGPVAVPMKVVRNCEFSVGSENPAPVIEWDELPFPEDCDWPGPKGEPSLVGEKEIILRGHPIRTKQTYVAPVTFECEVEARRPLADDGAFQFKLMPEDTPRELVTPQLIDCQFGYRARDGSGGHLTLNRASHPGQQLTRKRFGIEPGHPYKLRIEVLRDSLRITLDERSYEVTDLALSERPFYIQLMNWHPGDPWVVRKLSIRDGAR